MKKRMLALIVFAIALFTLAACNGDNTSTETSASQPAAESTAAETETTASDGDVHVAAIFKALNAEYWKTMQAGCEAAADELGIQVTVLGPNSESEIAQQVTMIEEQLAAGVDAIIVAPTDENAVIGALSPYAGQLPIFAIDTDFELEGKTAFAGTGNISAAKLGGEYAAKAMGEGGKVVLIGGQQGESTSNARLEGFKQGLEENGCEVLETQYGKNTADGAIAVMEDLLTKYPGEIQAVLAMNDDMIQGCQQAIQNAGVDGITLVGFNGDAGVVKLISEGKIDATVAQQPYDMGYETVKAAYQAIQGETIAEHMDIPAVLITEDNAAEFLK